MGQDSNAYAKAVRENDIMVRKQQEEAERDMLRTLYCFASELCGKNDSAAEMEAETKLDEAVETGKPATEILRILALGKADILFQ